MLGNPFWAAFGTTLGFAWIVSPVPDHHHQAESLESAKLLGSQASACMSSEHRSELLLAELRELRGELAQLSNRVLSLESQIQGSSFLSNPPITVNYSVAGASAFGTSNSPPGSPLPTSAAQTPVTSTGRHRASDIQRLSDGQQRLRLGVSSAALSKKSIGGRALATASSCCLECTSLQGHLWVPLQPSQDLSLLCCHQAPCQGGRGVREQCFCGTPYRVGGQSCSARCRPELACR